MFNTLFLNFDIHSRHTSTRIIARAKNTMCGHFCTITYNWSRNAEVTQLLKSCQTLSNTHHSPATLLRVSPRSLTIKLLWDLPNTTHLQRSFTGDWVNNALFIWFTVMHFFRRCSIHTLFPCLAAQLEMVLSVCGCRPSICTLGDLTDLLAPRSTFYDGI